MTFARRPNGQALAVDPATRFWSKVDRTSSAAGCWLWVGAHNDQGYGQLSVNDRMVYAHRFAYVLIVGSIPIGYDLDHVVCQNPGCVNPWHLEPVPHRVNLLRGRSPMAVAVRTNRCARGHPLTDAYVAPSGHRQCRPCRDTRQRERRARIRAHV